MPPKRMTANPVKPSRYRAGRPIGPEQASESDSSEEEEEEEKHESKPIRPPPKAASAGKIVSNLGKVDLNARQRETKEKEERRVAAEKAERLAAEEGFVTEEESEDEEEDEDEDESDEEEESSEEEAPRRLMIRPKFIPKSQRNAQQPGASIGSAAQDEDARLAEEEANRKAAADALVEEQIEKDLAARAAGRQWNDDQDEDEEVDTEDDVDPEAEYAAWKLRELKRIKRDREAIEAKEREREEIERRKNLTEEERRAEDEDFLAKQQEEKDSRGKMGYMQRYFHKGAFYREEAKEAGLDKRDLMGSRFADEVDRSVLPAYLQQRDQAKIGRKGASKYKDLKSEDTGRWGDFDRPERRGGGGGGFDRDVDERFRPDGDRGGGPREGQGANSVPLGPRKASSRSPARGPSRDERPRETGRFREEGEYDRDREDRQERPLGRQWEKTRDQHKNWDRDRDSHRRSRDDDYRRRDRSRSRSPRIEREGGRDDYYSRRKRSTSRDRDRYEDKRRRVERR